MEHKRVRLRDEPIVSKRWRSHTYEQPPANRAKVSAETARIFLTEEKKNRTPDREAENSQDQSIMQDEGERPEKPKSSEEPKEGNTGMERKDSSNEKHY